MEAEEALNSISLHKFTRTPDGWGKASMMIINDQDYLPSAMNRFNNQVAIRVSFNVTATPKWFEHMGKEQHLFYYMLGPGGTRIWNHIKWDLSSLP